MRNADALQALDRDLRAVFGNRLRSLVTYRTDDDEGPVSTMAIVQSLTADDLRTCAQRGTIWRGRGLATPLVLEAGEFDRSLDAFPFEFGSILAEHEIVSGPDPFDGLAVDPADLRRACEVRARSHLLHLREGYLEVSARSEAVADLIARSAPALAALLKHVARLFGAFDVPPVLARVAELGSAGTLSAEEAHRLFPGYLEAVTRLVSDLDRWTHP
ncbi:MAG: hypothetical protein AB7Q29_17895 [Vicinamibacterales bacterium]